MDLIAALIMGMVGSFHCLGMCGPIAIALPSGGDKWSQKIFGISLYNLGRTITYTILGALVGMLGQGFSLAGWQQALSIGMGIIMIASIIFPSFAHKITGNNVFHFMTSVKSGLQKYFTKQSLSSLFIIGLLNGLLPCGLVYMALAGALATASFTHGVLFMLLFGLGTIPMLFTLSLLGNIAGAKFKKIIRKVIPYIVVLVGILFILRGMELGIKYISPPGKMMKVPDKAVKIDMDHPHKCGGDMKCGGE